MTPFLSAMIGVGVVVYFTLAVAFVWYHWRRRAVMKGVDHIIRWPLAAQFLLVAWGLLALGLGWPAEVRVPPIVLAGILPTVGMIVLLWWDYHPAQSNGGRMSAPHPTPAERKP